MQIARLVIIGAGIAGVSALKAFRELDKISPVIMIDAEDVLPYKRTKLSKIIAGSQDLHDIELEQEAFWEQEVHTQLMLGYQVEQLDIQQKLVQLDHGDPIQYDKLLLCTGAQANLPAVFGERARKSVHVLRSYHDLLTLRTALVHSRRVLVLGMGVLGLEVAEQLAIDGKKVTVSGHGSWPLSQQLDSHCGTLIEQACKAHGITVLPNDELQSVREIERRLQSGLVCSAYEVRFSSGLEERFDLIVVCTGSKPRIAIAQSAGLAVGTGILVNSCLQTSQSDIFAAGDCIEFEDGGLCHLWHESEHLGNLAGKHASGQELPLHNPGFRLKTELFGQYFWSMGQTSQVHQATMLSYDYGTHYYSVNLSGGVITGIIMAGDKEHAGMYEQAVRERTTLQAFQAMQA